MTTTTLAANGALQYFTVPEGITRLGYELAGACGASIASTDIDAPDVQAPGKGAMISGYLDVTPGETLWVALGAAGSLSSTQNGTGFASGGANGGGAASLLGRGAPSLETAIVIAGGGGGGGEDGIGGSGGGIGGRSQGSGGGGQGGGQDPTYTTDAGEPTGVGGCGGGGGGITGGRAGTLANDRRGGGGGGASKVPPGASVRSTHSARGQATFTYGLAPGTPVIESPAAGKAIAAGRPVTLRHRFVGSGAGDVQTSAIISYTTATGNFTEVIDGPGTDVVIPAVRTPTGVLSWSVVTRGQGDAASPPATSSVPLAVAVAAPVITGPADDATVPGAQVTVTWTAAEQVAYRVRRRNTDGSAVYATVTVLDPAARSAVLGLDTSGRAELVDVEVQGTNLVWSDPDTVRIVIAWTRPPTPAVVLAPDPSKGSIFVAVTRPAGAAPAGTTYEAIETATGARARIDVGPDGRWRTPASGVDYAVAATDVSALGVPATGISEAPDLGWGLGLWGAAPWGSPRP